MRCRDSDKIQRLISDIFYREILWKCDAEIRIKFRYFLRSISHENLLWKKCRDSDKIQRFLDRYFFRRKWGHFLGSSCEVSRFGPATFAYVLTTKLIIIHLIFCISPFFFLTRCKLYAI